MTKTKNMQNFFLVAGLLFTILAAICGFGYNYYSNLNSEKVKKMLKRKD
jgi:hypothetical protein